MRTIVICLLLPALAAANAAAAEGTGAIAAAEYEGFRARVCPPPDAPPFDFAEAFDTAKQRMDPVRVFDNLHFVGMKTASSWALTTPEGIILLDAMFHYNVKETIVAGLETLGFDPASIKYVLISHGHNDHFGGAAYLQQTYGARIVMSKADWDHIEKAPQLGSPAPLPKRDIEAQDGDEVALGGTSIKLVLTPGHTPGAMSFVFPVRDGGQEHLVGYWGSGAVAFLPPADIETYIRSAHRFAGIDPRIDAEMSNHPFLDGGLLKFAALAERAPGATHPYVTGNGGFRRWMGVVADCAGEVLARKQAAKPPS